MLPRTRLFRRLDEARARRVVWIAGSPGAGKTTLVASYLESRRVPCLWYQLDEADADVATFFHYLGLAAKRFAPRAADLPALTPEFLGGIGIFARRWFRELCSRLEPPFALVFDNYEQVPIPSDLQAVMREALAEVPEGIEVFLVSRGEAPPALARLRANGEMATVSGEELRLTLEESRGIAALRRRPHAPQSVDELHRRSDGWTAGLVLMLEQLGVERAPCGPPQVIFDYFAGEIFDRAESVAQKVLLETALLPKVSHDAASRLTGVADAGRILRDLAQRGYFTVMYDGPQRWFAFHPLFREFLLRRGAQELAPARVSELRRCGARLLEEGGHADATVELWREEGCWDEIARIALAEAPAMLEEGRGATVRRWLDGAPAEVLRTRPWLLFWCGLAAYPFDPPSGRQMLEECYARFSARDDARALYVVWGSAVNACVYAWDTLVPLDRWIDEWELLRRRHPEFPSAAIEERAVIALATALAFRRPRHPELPGWHDRCARIAAESADPRSRIAAAIMLVTHRVWTGDHHAVPEITEILEPAASRSRDVAMAVVWGAVEAFSRWFGAGSGRTALQSYDGALAVARESGARFFDPVILSNAALCAAAIGDVDAAERLQREAAAAIVPGRSMQSANWYSASAQVALLRGDVGRAVRDAQTSLDLARETGAHFGETWAGVTLALAQLRTGRPDAAMQRLADVRRRGQELGTHYTEYLCLVAEAHVALAVGDPHRARPLLERAFALGAAKGIWVQPMLRPCDVAELCAFALEQGIEVEHVRELITRCELLPPDGAVHLESWPRAVEIRALGSFEVLRNGRPLSFPGRVQRKPVELLKLLVVLGGAEVREETLVDALWPDADGDAARHALETTVYRLRKLLGSDDVLVQRDRRLTLDARRCWVDAWAVERRVTVALAAAENGGGAAPGETVGEAHRVLALYRGPLLAEDEAQASSRAMRDRLRGKLGRYFDMLARRVASGEHRDEILRLRRRCIEVDPALGQGLRLVVDGGRRSAAGEG